MNINNIADHLILASALADSRAMFIAAERLVKSNRQCYLIFDTMKVAARYRQLSPKPGYLFIKNWEESCD